MNCRRRPPLLILAAVTAAFLLSCSGGGGGGSPAGGGNPTPSRSFMMGSTPYMATPGVAPDWKFENLGDKDLLSLHVDDFWGVPWDQCNAAGCTNLPNSWVSSWQTLAANAHATGKTLYLAVSPLGDRKTLARSVQANGSLLDHWAPMDAHGCYDFVANAANASTYAAAYIGYSKYIIDLVQPKYFSPAIEMNMPFTSCPTQKAAWIAWYEQVYGALKAAYPTLIVFPTFQLEHMYGVEQQDACAGPPTDRTGYDQCFDQRLTEALAIRADRLAFSIYPEAWSYSSAYSYSYPRDTFARARAATARKLWVSETGWQAVPVLQSYPHGSSGSCGAALLPATLDVPGFGTVDMANDKAQAAYISWLLGEAQSQGLEAVVWWLNRDYLDGAVAATCPCAPSNSDTCTMADNYYTAGGDYVEMLLRVFGNMALRNNDGTPRPGYSTWKQWIDRPYVP